MENVIEYIVCPIDKAPLIDKKEIWECSKCRAKFKVTNGIPNLIPEEAEIKSKES